MPCQIPARNISEISQAFFRFFYFFHRLFLRCFLYFADINFMSLQIELLNTEVI